MFGKRKLLTSPLKIAVDADLELVRDFGPATVTDIARGLGPRVERLARAAAARVEATGDRSGLAVLEYFATGYTPAWLSLARLQQELGEIDAAIGSLNRFVEANPADPEGWRHLTVLYRQAGDALGEMHARLQLAELARPLFAELSTAAGRLNGLLSRRELPVEHDERRLLIRRLRQLIENRVTEADATDLSRLAWLCVHAQDEAAAAKWAQDGLSLEPANEHCRSLLRKLGVQPVAGVTPVEQ